MEVKPLAFALVAAAAALLAIILGAISWSSATNLSLPLPQVLPALSTLFPVVLLASTAFIRVFGRNTGKDGRPPRWLNNVIRSLRIMDRTILLASVIIATLAASYLAPSDVLTCRMETRWQRLYMNKDAVSIRAIQSALQCCGFRSIHDRAWPFKDANHDDTACERALGYTQSCIGGWRQKEETGSWFVFVAALLTILLKFILAKYEPSSRVWYRSRPTEAGLHPRINEVLDPDSNGRYIAGPERQRITGRYTDDPEQGEESERGLHPGDAGVSEEAEHWRDHDHGSGSLRNGEVHGSGL